MCQDYTLSKSSMPLKKGCLPRRSSTPTIPAMSRSPLSRSCRWSPWHWVDTIPRCRVYTDCDPTKSKILVRMGLWSVAALAGEWAGRMVEALVWMKLGVWADSLAATLAELLAESTALVLAEVSVVTSAE